MRSNKLDLLKSEVENKENGLYKIYINIFKSNGKYYVGRTRTSVDQRNYSHIFDSKMKSDTSLHWELNSQNIENMKEFREKVYTIVLIDPNQGDNSDTEKEVIRLLELANSEKLLNVLLRKNRPL